jgi:RES domain-containing protein
MSIIDAQLYGHYSLEERDLCVRCFDDEDLKDFIRAFQTKGRCSFCEARNVTIAPLRDMAGHLLGFMKENYSKAADELPYESREGGYQGGSTYSTWEVLIEQIGLPLVGTGEVDLGQALADAIGEDVWCDYDWTALDLDESLRYSWDRFCETVKHYRRFFFQGVGRSKYSGVDDRSSIQILREIKRLLKGSGLIKKVPSGYKLYRARPRRGRRRYTTAAELASPPVEFALQSNRMNPPGIPMFYGAESRKLAVAEVRSSKASIGRFRTTRKIRILDLADLPPMPGFFSGAHRNQRLYLSFLHEFTREIVKAVPRDERTHIDYLPTQVFTEYLREARFGGKRIDGIRYPSATGEAGANVVLFATQEDFVGVGEEDPHFIFRQIKPWLELTGLSHV